MPTPAETDDEPRAPAPWRRETSERDRIAYERTADSDRRRTVVRLTACRSSESHPPGSGDSGWALTLETRWREVSTQSTTTVGSRSIAVQSLFGAMRAVNETIAAAGAGACRHTTLADAVETRTDRW